MQLIPKISLQFYSVKPQNFETKASVVADCIVDDLEKRKAFRRVIKKAQEDLMKTPKVKGVNILLYFIQANGFNEALEFLNKL